MGYIRNHTHIMEMKEAQTIASRFYLTEEFPPDIWEGTDIFEVEVGIDTFIVEHLWQPFEDWQPNDVWCLIDDLAREIMDVHDRALLSTLEN